MLMGAGGAWATTRNESIDTDAQKINNVGDSTMKLLIATVALATVIAAPAFAPTSNPRAKTQQSQVLRGADQSNQFGRTENGQRHSTNPSHDVYDGSGHYVGSDPDPRIRQDLINDRAE
jgi:hypothetical protein